VTEATTSVSSANTQPGFLRVISGYLVAVLIASVVVIAMVGLPTGNERFLFQLFMMFIMGSAYTFVCALPGFVATVLIARAFDLRSWLFFILAGGLDGMVSVLLVDHFLLAVSGVSPGSSLNFFAVVGGLSGGLAYRLIAYRLRHTWA
jgi:hypothetical protein